LMAGDDIFAGELPFARLKWSKTGSAGKATAMLSAQPTSSTV
jgi:hypothetical protein